MSLLRLSEKPDRVRSICLAFIDKGGSLNDTTVVHSRHQNGVCRTEEAQGAERSHYPPQRGCKSVSWLPIHASYLFLQTK